MNDQFFHLNNFDEFDETEIVQSFPRNPYDDEADNLFGLGNKQKKAERKLAKAEKKLAQGKTSKAAKKISKANKLLGQIDKGHTALDSSLATAQARAQINKATPNLNTMNPASNESMQTEAGQIGLNSQPATSYGGGGGGGGEDMSTGYTNEANPSPEENLTGDEPTGDLAKVKDLQGVTVTGGKKDNKIILYAIGAVLLFLIITFVMKKKK
jgi:hypothetical protein